MVTFLTPIRAVWLLKVMCLMKPTDCLVLLGLMLFSAEVVVGNATGCDEFVSMKTEEREHHVDLL